MSNDQRRKQDFGCYHSYDLQRPYIHGFQSDDSETIYNLPRAYDRIFRCGYSIEVE